ncbi:hypothetical protein STAQ_32690 [Allostella sp. ATCC 35155]|nr:hypothetical protein STAQ_32690 [Stella sp. ATCC 35155]
MPVHHRPPVSAALIAMQGRELHGIEIADGRAVELAAELDRINRQAEAAIPEFWFFDEPIQFLAELDALARPEDGE